MSRPLLVLTVTRRCDHRCAYCPTVKDGWPDLPAGDVARAIDLFVDRYGEGDVKVFGGEPLLHAEAVRAALDRTDGDGRLRLHLSTNGASLDEGWLARLEARPDVVLTASLDGRAEDHRRLRRRLDIATPDTHDTLLRHLPRLLRLPRFTVTQTIAPATAAAAADNFRYVRGLGVRRFNLLPGYYIPWREEQVRALAAAFDGIAAEFETAWRRGEPLALRNLFVWAPTPFFNTGMVVDCDGGIHPSNVALTSAGDPLRAATRAGSLDDPPSREALDAAQARVPELLRQHLPGDVLDATDRVDALLTALCRRLYPAFAAFAERRSRASHARPAVARSAP